MGLIGRTQARQRKVSVPKQDTDVIRNIHDRRLEATDTPSGKASQTTSCRSSIVGSSAVLDSQRDWLRDAVNDPSTAQMLTVAVPCPERRRQSVATALQGFDLVMAMAQSPELTHLERYCAKMERFAEQRKAKASPAPQ